MGAAIAPRERRDKQAGGVGSADVGGAASVTARSTQSLLEDRVGGTFSALVTAPVRGDFRMNRTRFLVAALALASAFLATTVTPAAAAPPPPDTIQANICHDDSQCINGGSTITGTGQDVRIVQFNQCYKDTLCTNDLTLVGDFGTVVILRSNNCTDGSTCSNNVTIDGTVQHLIIRQQTLMFEQFKILNHCDRSSTCSNSPSNPRV